MSKQRSVYQLTVADIQPLSPNLCRFVLQGDGLGDFPDDYEGGYVKLVLPRPGDEGQLVDVDKSIKRSYTVRAFDRAVRRLTLEFAGHDAEGPAMRWANTAEVGTEVSVVGPGPVKMLDPTADWFLLAGDMTALPAIAVNLSRLPKHARGYALIEIVSDQDRQSYDIPKAMDVQWIVNPDPQPDKSPLDDAIRKVDWLPGQVSAWVACEFNAMLAIRRYFRDELELSKDDMYISSYWKIGSTDEQHKNAKRGAAEAIPRIGQS